MSVFDHVSLLHDCALWSDLVALGGFLLPMMHCADGGSPGLWLSTRHRVQAQIFMADALFETKQFQKAEAVYKEALQARKQIGKTKTLSGGSADDDVKLAPEVEIKYKMHLCYLQCGQPQQAVNILQSIPAKQRTPKLNLALARMYQQGGMERPSVTCYKEVLKSCPLALETAQTLMQMGIKGREIQELMVDITAAGLPGLEWLTPWVLGYASLAARDYVPAVAALRALEAERPRMRNNVTLLAQIGSAQHQAGDSAGALLTMQRVRKLDPLYLKGADFLASLLAREKKVKDLETLATQLMGVSEDAPEAWIAMGYYCYVNKKGSRAVYFAHKACMLDSRSLEALLLKGSVFLELKKLADAMNHFREAMQLAPHRYECHKGTVDCYLGQGRHREAVGAATSACKQLGNSARALTLYADVLIKDPLQLSVQKAKSLLEKALSTDPNHLPAVYLLAELLEGEMRLDAAVELLRRQLATNSTCRLHQMLADLLAKTHDEEKAMEHYGIALNLDPKNLPAQEGLQKMEQATDTVLDNTYDMEIEDMNSDEADLEESETEAVWSDGDLNLGTGSNASY